MGEEEERGLYRLAGTAMVQFIVPQNFTLVEQGYSILSGDLR